MRVVPKGMSFTANLGTKAAVLPKSRSSTTNSGTKVAVLQGMNRCGSYPLLSAPPHSLFSIWTDLKRSEKIPGTIRTSPKFTTGVKYNFHQGFLPGQKSGKPNDLLRPNSAFFRFCLSLIVWCATVAQLGLCPLIVAGFASNVVWCNLQQLQPCIRIAMFYCILC